MDGTASLIYLLAANEDRMSRRHKTQFHLTLCASIVKIFNRGGAEAQK